MAHFIKEQDGIKYLEVDKNLYSSQAINSTIYKMAELCSIQQKMSSDSTIQILFNVTEEKHFKC